MSAAHGETDDGEIASGVEAAAPPPVPAPVVTSDPDAAVAARRRRLRMIVTPLLLLVVGFAAYTVLAIVAGGRVPRGTTVAGLPIGGLSRDAAVEKLRAASDPLQGKGLPVTVGQVQARLDLVDAGLAFDPGELVDSLAGFSLSPVTVWHHLAGGTHVDVEVRDEALTEALTTLARSTDTPPTQAQVTFTGTEPVIGPTATGTSLDVPAATDVVRRTWLSATGPVRLPVRTVQPTIGRAEAEQAVKSLGRPALASPLVIALGGRTATLPPSAVARALRLVAAPDGTGLQLAVDGDELHDALLRAAPGIEAPARDARIVIRDDQPVVLPGVPGEGVDAAELGRSAEAALAGDHRLSLTPAPTQPRLTTEKARALGVREQVSTFATKLTDNALRTENLRVAAKAVDGTLVLPGQTFSLNAVLGERTPEKGYNQAPAINGGRLVKDYGGGVSQMATTIFNNVFFAGLEDVYHKPHSFYISRYPEGREATVNWPTVDLKWRNDSPYAVLVQAWVDTKVHVSFWSTERWDVEALKSPRSNVTQPQTIYDPSDGCVSQDPSPGFDVTVTRVFKKDGAEVKRQTFKTTYIPEDDVICSAKPYAKTSAPPD